MLRIYGACRPIAGPADAGQDPGITATASYIDNPGHKMVCRVQDPHEVLSEQVLDFYVEG